MKSAVLLGLALLAVAGCSQESATVSPSFPAQRVQDVCIVRPADLSLQDIATVEDPGARESKLDLLATQVAARVDLARAMALEFGESEPLEALVTEGLVYEEAVDAYRQDGERLGDALGDAILAEGAFFSACSEALSVAGSSAPAK